MKTPLFIVLLLAGFIVPGQDVSAIDSEAVYTEEKAYTERPAGENKILAVTVSKSDLHVDLLGTVVNGNISKALVKNPVTGELGTYIAGDVLDLVRTETVNVIEVANCVVLLERAGGVLETIECNNKMPTVVFTGPAALAKYRIVRPGEKEDAFALSANFSSDYDSEILTASVKHDVDPYLVKAVIKAESNFDPNAISPKNAQGMMQLIPATASDYGVDDPFDPVSNIEGGVRYLKDLMEYFDGDMKLSLAAYNAGKGAVIKHGFTIPPYPETTDYITKVLGYYKIMKAKNYVSKN
jgi:hypothetical protein